jgi:uncharacterized protein (TIGR00661 family)
MFYVAQLCNKLFGMKFLFIVQGEGRGHMTQAIALRNILVRNGHEVVSTLVGKSARREFPAFFIEKIQAPVSGFDSPNFVLDPKNKGLKIMETFKVNLLQARKYLDNLKDIDTVVVEHQPDVIINFYDLLAGMYSFFYKEKRGFRFVCVGHQFLLEHPDFEFPEGHGTDRFLLHNNTVISAAKSDLNLALSFVKMRDVPQKHLFVVPPLLRQEVLDLEPEDNDFILGYMVNDGYAEEIITWHEQNKHISLVCFWDRKGVENPYHPHENLVFHKLDDVKFLEHMRACKAYVSTAGFESICEAMYLGKPVMMIPTANHFEQLCNAIDAVKAGAGIRHDKFDISLLVDYLPHHQSKKEVFRKWASGAENKFITLLTNL